MSQTILSPIKAALGYGVLLYSVFLRNAESKSIVFNNDEWVQWQIMTTSNYPVISEGWQPISEFYTQLLPAALARGCTVLTCVSINTRNTHVCQVFHSLM